MRIYVASFFNTKARLIPVAQNLRAMGHEITSTWLTETKSAADTAKEKGIVGFPEGYLLSCAVLDVGDIRRSEILILDTLDITARGGREVELGMALAWGIPVFQVGPDRNVFHKLIKFKFNSWEECLAFIKEVHK